MTISLSHGGTTMFNAAAPAQRILLATMNGIDILERENSGPWKVALKALPGKHIQAIVEEPQSKTLFACGYRDGVYASDDDGRTWAPRDRGIHIRNVYSLATVVMDGRVRMFAGTEPAHVFVSEDLGHNWRELADFRNMPTVGKWRFVAEPYVGHAKHINFDPANPRIMYVCVEVGAMGKSTDGGETWTAMPIPNPDMHRTVIDPRDTSRVFTTGGGGLQLSTDGGGTWRQLLARDSFVGEYGDQLVYRSPNPDVMLLGCAEFSPRSWISKQYAGGVVAKSEDAGRSWRILQGGLPKRTHGAIEAMCQVESPQGAEYFFGTTDGEIWHGVDDGETWQMIASVAPVSKSVHYEMLTGDPQTPMIHTDGTRTGRHPQPQAVTER